MNGARFKWCTGLASLAVAALAFGGPAQAADLGGDCCADLEERIAELEATTARKGNRKVSLTITGWVSQMVMFWDDGYESNVYVVQDATDLASNVSFTGTAQITSDWSAGYLINVFFEGTNALAVTQDEDDAGFGITAQRMKWWLESKTYGKLTVGTQSATGDNVAILTDFTGTLFTHNNVTFEGGFMFLQQEGNNGARTGVNWANTFFYCHGVNLGLGSDCNGLRTDAVRYDTPTFAGFQASVSYNEDDAWETAIKYAGEFGGFKVSTAAGYGWVNGDSNNGRVLLNGVPLDVEYFQVGATIKHLQSALWIHGTYGIEDTDNAATLEGDSWYVKVGWSPKLNSLGTTHFIAEYFQANDMSDITRGSAETCANFDIGATALGLACAGAADATIQTTGTTGKRYGFGIVQEIDAAAMNIWAKWRMYEGEIDFVDTTTGAAGTQDFEDLQMFMVGAFIFF